MSPRAKHRLVDLEITRIDRTGDPDNPEARVQLMKARPTEVDKRHATRSERRRLNHDRILERLRELIEAGIPPEKAAEVLFGQRGGRARQLAEFVSAPARKEHRPMSTSEDVHEKIQKRAEAIRQSDRSLTAEQAELQALENDPALYKQYRDAKAAEPELTGAPPPVEKKSVGDESFRQRVERLIQERADEWVLKGVDPVRSYELALEDRVLKQAMWWSRQPSAREPVAKAVAELAHVGMPGEVTRAVI